MIICNFSDNNFYAPFSLFLLYTPWKKENKVNTLMKSSLLGNLKNWLLFGTKMMGSVTLSPFVGNLDVTILCEEFMFGQSQIQLLLQQQCTRTQRERVYTKIINGEYR